MRWLLPIILCISAAFSSETTSPPPSEITVDLRNPIYKNGVLFTEEGGVIRGQDLRIQAKSIQYTKREEAGVAIHKIEAEGDLMIQYHGRIFVGSELEYDLIKKTGTIY